MGALEWVDADFHKFDVFACWPDGTISRPQLVAFHDIYSGKVLSWRVAVAAAWSDLVEDKARTPPFTPSQRPGHNISGVPSAPDRVGPFPSGWSF